MDAKIKKRMLRLFSVLIVSFALYSVLYFVLYFSVINTTLSAGSFWVTYGFTGASLTILGLFFWLAFVRKQNTWSKILTIPSIKVIFILVIIQFITDIVIMVVGNSYRIPFWVTLLGELVVYFFGIIFAASRAEYRKLIEEVESNGETKTSFMNEVRIQAQLLCSLSSGKPFSGDIEKISEALKYADPVSIDAVKDLEDDILESLSNLKQSIINERDDDVHNLSSKILIQLEERRLRSKITR